MDTMVNAAFVSCDLINYSAVSDHSQQLRILEGLNGCIRAVCQENFDRQIIWASGGDGGHVAFLDESLRATVIELIRLLFAWSLAIADSGKGFQKPRIGLRLTAHQGPVSVIDGADGRKQLVGDGINFCGSLLNFGTSGTVVVSAQFREFLLRGQSTGNDLLDRVSFHDERTVYLKHFLAQRVYFMSLAGHFESRQGFPDKSDRIKLTEATDKKRRWAVIYHAKRLLQADSSDEDANRELNSLHPQQLLSTPTPGEEPVVNPLLGLMSRESLVRLIKAAQLVERDDGEVICAKEDSGDTMFIVLKGEIGVVLEHKNGAVEQQKPGNPQDVRYREGVNVGELALALMRKRTATMQAVGSTAMLAIDYASLASLLNSLRENDPLRKSFNDFLLSRILEHICRTMPYLSTAVGGPLAGLIRPWETLVHGSRLIVRSWDKTISPQDEDFQQPGLYILASGRLIEASLPHGIQDSEIAAKKHDGHEFPLLYVDHPGELVNVHHTYRFDQMFDSKTITIVRIGDEDLKHWGPRVYGAVLQSVRKQLCQQAQIDVFISYSQHNQQVVRTWFEAMTKKGLKVYMSQPDPMKRFKNEIEVALREALVMVPFVSQEALGPEGAESWVQREIRVRKSLFDENHCNILPVEMTPGIAGRLADGFSAISVSGKGDAIEEATATVQDVRAARKPLPFSLRRLIRPVL